MIRVLLADDQALVRKAFALLLGSAADLEVVGEASDGVEAVRLAGEQRPDVVLMDVRMPHMDGVEATRRIVAEAAGRTRVLVLTTFDSDDSVFASLAAGASGFLLKDVDPDALLDAIRVVAAGESLLAPRATRRVIEEYLASNPRTSPPPRDLAALTDREREVLQAIAAGLSNVEIARDLHVSYATAKTHVSHLLTKLDARDRIQLVVLAYQCGLVP